LTPNHDVWRLLKANRAAMLIDGADYFGAVRSAMVRAKHTTVLIAGWDMHSQTRAPATKSPSIQLIDHEA
jgi:phospholipase D1/2